MPMASMTPLPEETALYLRRMFEIGTQSSIFSSEPSSFNWMFRISRVEEI